VKRIYDTESLKSGDFLLYIARDEEEVVLSCVVKINFFRSKTFESKVLNVLKGDYKSRNITIFRNKEDINNGYNELYHITPEEYPEYFV
jgi:hypothetical protein